ncbi:MAG TPA: 6-carboxytetrahydropterin synthase [Pyrinomonadaceae bacterium]|nr:6-carboxytetrahydropterin synthase [Pyrinomonadaceae bacterium]
MLLTVSKRLEFSASRRLFVRDWTKGENLIAFGPETEARHGSGRNYVAYFIFAGPVDPVTGMLINISEIKERAGKVLRDNFDHKFLNEDNSSFRDVPPTAENVARQLFVDVAPLFSDVEAKLRACHLSESPERSATYYADGACEGNYWFEFSAARNTMSPHLSKQENARLFGKATSTHGHNYRARLTFRAARLDRKEPLVRYDTIDTCLRTLHEEFDHRYLNQELAELKNRPITTESLAGYIFERVNRMMPAHRVRLHERDDFFAEAWSDKIVFLGLRVSFTAVHRLHAAALTDPENAKLYGKCNNPRGHGHWYLTETTVGGEYDARSGTLYDLVAFKKAIEESLKPWQDRHLDLEIDDFRDAPSTGENIVRALWPKIDNRIGQQLVRLRLWETANNRFTLRRS